MWKRASLFRTLFVSPDIGRLWGALGEVATEVASSPGRLMAITQDCDLQRARTIFLLTDVVQSSLDYLPKNQQPFPPNPHLKRRLLSQRPSSVLAVGLVCASRTPGFRFPVASPAHGGRIPEDSVVLRSLFRPPAQRLGDIVRVPCELVCFGPFPG